MTLKNVIDKLNCLDIEVEKTRKFRQQFLTALNNFDNTEDDLKTVHISFSKKETLALCDILLNHIGYTNDLIKELNNIDIPDVV